MKYERISLNNDGFMSYSNTLLYERFVCNKNNNIIIINM